MDFCDALRIAWRSFDRQITEGRTFFASSERCFNESWRYPSLSLWRERVSWQTTKAAADDVAPADLGHDGEIEVTDLRKTLSETVAETVSRLNRRKFLLW